jgi:hypothetical protein
MAIAWGRSPGITSIRAKTLIESFPSPLYVVEDDIPQSPAICTLRYSLGSLLRHRLE